MLLEPCPFCGGEAKARAIRDGQKVYCRECHASGPPAYYGPNGGALKRAAHRWNDRITDAERKALEDGDG